MTRLGWRNAACFPSRSVWTTSLIASAVFLIVAIGLLRYQTHDDTPRRPSGNGGFALIGESATAIFGSFSDPEGRFKIGIPEQDEPIFEQATSFSLRVRDGDDTSCLNLYKPRVPGLLAAPEEFLTRGGFSFAGTLPLHDAEKENPWLLLNRTMEDGAIPAIGDANALQWILHLRLGDTLEMEDETGKPFKLRIVGALSGSIFQNRLIISERDFLKVYPAIMGKRYFLFETEPARVPDLKEALKRDFSSVGMEVVTTGEQLAAFRAVEATYMAAFQTLGGLGLLLGTVGLGAVLARNVLERRGEFGLLRAVGFRGVHIAWIILSETIFLLASGLLLGGLAACLAVAPEWLKSAGSVDYGSLLGLIGGVFFTGLLSGLAAVGFAIRTRVLTALRTE